jgi:hypothetical protein
MLVCWLFSLSPSALTRFSFSGRQHANTPTLASFSLKSVAAQRESMLAEAANKQKSRQRLR